MGSRTFFQDVEPFLVAEKVTWCLEESLQEAMPSGILRMWMLSILSLEPRAGRCCMMRALISMLLPSRVK